MLIKLPAAEGRQIAREGAPKSLKRRCLVWVCRALLFQGKSRGWSLNLVLLLCLGGVVGSVGMAVQGLSLPAAGSCLKANAAVCSHRWDCSWKQQL